MEKEHIRKILYDYTHRLIPSQYRAIVQQWIISDLDSSEKDIELRQLFDNRTVDESGTDAALQVFKDRREQYKSSRARHHRIYKLLRYAALFLLPVLAALLTWRVALNYYGAASEMIECHVPNGTTHRVVLSDGTVVTVNGGSSVIYPKTFRGGGGCRNVFLNGEAHFDVKKDQEHPFIVNVGPMKVKVLGTHFDIKAYSDEQTITTTLEKGRVMVYDSLHSLILVPNELASYHRTTNKLTKSKVNAAKYCDWIRGNLFFNNRPLAGILSDLEHKYNVCFKVGPHVNLDKRYTMDFNAKEDVNSVLNILQKLTRGLKYKKHNETIYLYMERKEGQA
ncbi:MAG: FecR family protein [Prevotella sp.]